MRDPDEKPGSVEVDATSEIPPLAVNHHVAFSSRRLSTFGLCNAPNGAAGQTDVPFSYTGYLICLDRVPVPRAGPARRGITALAPIGAPPCQPSP